MFRADEARGPLLRMCWWSAWAADVLRVGFCLRLVGCVASPQKVLTSGAWPEGSSICCVVSPIVSGKQSLLATCHWSEP